MAYDNLAGTWVYRSFVNLAGLLPEPDPNSPSAKDDLTKWAGYLFGQGEMHFHPQYSGALGGRFVMAPGLEMTLSGRFVGVGDETRVYWHGTGEADEDSDGWVYEYQGTLVPNWPDGSRQVQAIVGSVIRSVSHDDLAPNASVDRIARTGSVASFILVRKPFTEAHDSLPLPPTILTMLASKHHRLHHHLWHMTRDKWVENLNDQQRQDIEALGWKPPRANQRPVRGTVTQREPDNGAGEDFLFMHRQMILDVAAKLKSNNLPVIDHWVNIPEPSRRSDNPDGFSVPPNWDSGSAPVNKGMDFIKSDDYLTTRLAFLQRKFKDSAYLKTLTLDQLGAKIEWQIHNLLHIRWSSLQKDPETGVSLPNNRVETDIADKWIAYTRPDGSVFYYDDLNDTFSSHVHPVFWRLHGWVDDRIEDWSKAHSTGQPDDVQGRDLDGVPWFVNDGKWVTVDKPWVSGTDHSIQAMEKVVDIIRGEAKLTATFRNSSFIRKLLS